LAVDIYLPDSGDHGPLPTVIHATPYFRALEFRAGWVGKLFNSLSPLTPVWDRLTAVGYVSVHVDQRGSGASYGTRRVDPASQVRDLNDIITWIVDQPWSDGQVAAFGLSADALPAQLLLTEPHPALRASVCLYTAFDFYRACHPGGMLIQVAVGDVGAMMRGLDQGRVIIGMGSGVARALSRLLIRGIKPVDADRVDRLRLSAAQKEHVGNDYLDLAILEARYSDESLSSLSVPMSLDELSASSFADRMKEASIPIYCLGGWFDSRMAEELVDLHARVPARGNRLTLGPWGHGGRIAVQPEGRNGRSEFDLSTTVVDFLDQHLRPSVPVPEGTAVHYFTLPAKGWQSANQWPPDSTTRRLYLEPDRLAETPGSEESTVSYKVDTGTTSGRRSRWAFHLHLLRGVHYGDRSAQDNRLAVFDSPELTGPCEVTGHVCVRLSATCSRTDELFIVYLEDVTAQRSTYVTEGLLLASHRKVAVGAGPLGVRHSHRSADVGPIEAGERIVLELSLLPTSYVFAKGHRIRIAVAHADTNNFGAVNPEERELSIHCGGASYVDLPIVEA